jgi:hypothetical protein
MEKQAPTAEEGVKVQAERLMTKGYNPFHQPHPGPIHRPISEASNMTGHRVPPAPSQNNKEFHGSDYKNYKIKLSDPGPQDYAHGLYLTG